MYQGLEINLQKIYNYHPITLEYISEQFADLDPLDPGRYLIPAHATTIPAPSKIKGKILYFNISKQEWQYEDIPEKSYEEKRIAEYPHIYEQLDMLYHLGYDGWKEKIKQIKDKYPKE